MRFTFLGTGTSAGVPAIGCGCAVCRSDDPRDRRLRTSACVRWTDASGEPRTVLLDCGPDLREQALAAGLDRCDAVLFTHNHVDHTWGVDELRRFNAVMRRPIPVYAERHTLDFLHRVYGHIFDKAGNINDSFVATLVPHRLEPGVALDLHGVRFSPIRCMHGRLPIVGFRIEPLDARGEPTRQGPFPLAYLTDVSRVPTEAWAMLGGLETLVLDALRHRSHPTHLTLEQAVDLAGRIGAGRTCFVHMSHDLPHAETDAGLPEAMLLAWDGLTLE